MKKPRKLEKIFWFGLVRVVCNLNPKWSTYLQYYFLKKWGVQFSGQPNFIAGSVWFDGTDYGLIKIGKEVTLSSNISILTHDWAMHTVAKAFNVSQVAILGRIDGVTIGDYSFIGMGSILMPGCNIGRGCIIGAGSVVRGVIPDYSIYTGSPGRVIGDVKNYLSNRIGVFD